MQAKIFGVNVPKEGSLFKKYNKRFKEGLWLYKKKKTVIFNGFLNYFELLNFVKGNIVGRTMLRIKDSSKYKQVRSLHKYFFIFTGSKQSKRFHAITKSARKYPKTLLFKMSNKELISELGLESNQFYFINSTQKKPKTFSKNFTAVKLEKWVSLQVLRKYNKLASFSYDKMKRRRTAYVVLVIKNAKKNLKIVRNFLNFAEKTKSKALFRVCDLANVQCKRFLFRVGKSKIGQQKSPSVFIIQTSKQSSDDHIFIYKLSKNKKDKKKRLNLKKFKKFFLSVMKRKKLPKDFSEPIPPFKSPEKFQKIVKNTLNHFLFEGADKDLVVLFYDSRQCSQSCRDRYSVDWLCSREKAVNSASAACDNLVQKFKRIISKTRKQWKGQEGLVRYAHFDLGSNSYDLLGIKTKPPFVRLFKMGKKNDFADMKIDGELSSLYDEFSQFMLVNMEHLFEDQKDEDFDPQLEKNPTEHDL